MYPNNGNEFLLIVFAIKTIKNLTNKQPNTNKLLFKIHNTL